MRAKTRADILAHVERDYPREACGVIVAAGRREVYVPITNTATGDAHFAMDAAELARAEDQGRLIAVVHSHPNASAHASPYDRIQCERSGLPWHIVGWPSGVWSEIRPDGYVLPLLGREFAHGTIDCYTLVRDYYERACGLTLRDGEREWEWWLKGQRIYRDGIEAEGFVRVDNQPGFAGPQVHDAILIQVLSDEPNHAAVMCAPGVILHHLPKRLSCREAYLGYWVDHTASVWRHPACFGKSAFTAI